MPYPTGEELRNWLTGAGMLDTPISQAASLIDYEGAVAAAVLRWERDTGYSPFLGVSQTRTFDPPGPERGIPGYFAPLPGSISGRGLGGIGGSNKLFVRAGLLALTTLTVN